MLLFFSCRLQIPRSYLSLQEAVLAEQHRRSQNDDVQYLTDRQIELIVEQTPGNDIKDYEDLQTGRSEQTSNFLEISMCDRLKCSMNNKRRGWGESPPDNCCAKKQLQSALHLCRGHFGNWWDIKLVTGLWGEGWEISRMVWGYWITFFFFTSFFWFYFCSVKNEACHSFKAVFSVGPQSCDLYRGLALQEPGRALPCEDSRRRVKGRCDGNINTDCKVVRCGFYKRSAR